MKKIILLVICLYLGGIIMSSALDKVEENIFKITSKDFQNNEILSYNQALNAPECDGKNQSPELTWVNPPQNTKSFAIICHDPDAPRENGFYHWLVINIPSDVNHIDNSSTIKNSLETKTDFGTTGYGGPCPPKGHGIHHYNFTIYALDSEKLHINKNEAPKIVEQEVQKHAIAKTTITGLFERN